MIENFKLKVFRVVADTLNYRRAAEELHLTQPAVTAQIRSLEEGLGIALFDRMGRETTLTAAGTTLLEYVRKIEAIANDAVAALAPFGVQADIELNIGASHSLAIYLLPIVLADLQKHWPRLRINVRAGSTNEVLQSLTEHQVAVGLIEAPAYRPDLKVEVLGKDELALIVSPKHRWADKEMLTAAELVQEPIILREQGSGMRQCLEAYLEENGVLRRQLRSLIEMNNNEAIGYAVEAGLGIGLVPLIAVEKALKLGVVKVIPLENGPILRELSIVLPPGPDPRGPLADLVKLVKKCHDLDTSANSTR